MSILVIVAISIIGFLALFYFIGVSKFLSTADPIAWRIDVENKVHHDTMRYYRNGLTIEESHAKAIKHWYNSIVNLKARNPDMHNLFMEMLKSQFPKQLETYKLQIYEEDNKIKYANIKNKKEMIELIKSERTESGNISNIEKIAINRAIIALPIMENEEEIIEKIPHILIRFTEMGLPTTFEEVKIYLKQRIDARDTKANVFLD